MPLRAGGGAIRLRERGDATPAIRLSNEFDQPPGRVTVKNGYRLEDRYISDDGRVFMTSIQALARIAPEQLRRDRAASMNTAAFLSGYPGSPLGGFDLEVGRMLRLYPDLPIVHRPAVNEELGATAVMGSQLASARPDSRYDGVVGIWYGKAPGLDRATDALRHGVFAGTSPGGGAVALVGDDPAAKSSTMPSSSDAALVDLHMPILYPGTTSECLELGLHAVALSRSSGLWTAMKIVTPVADGSETVDLPILETDPILTMVERSAPSSVFLGSARMVAAEEEFRTVRSEAALRYGIENGLNRMSVSGPDDWIGIAATGYTYYELREALRRLGFSGDDDLRSAGIRLLHLRMPVPFDPELIRRFASGMSEVLVVEEKNPTLEWLVKDALYDLPERPMIFGKKHGDGSVLMPSHGLLDADRILPGLRQHLATRLADRLAPLPEPPRTTIPLTVNRTPFFCSGCPHNWGTKVPDGALVGAGTGCHGMSLLMPTELVGETFGITAMGNEGAHWIGMQPFVETPHVFQNFGDGTYFHSGQLAIQAAIGAGVSITFKILYNSTVAMTGGQDSTFSVGVGELARVLLAQGVKKVVVTVPEPKGYDRSGLPDGVEVWDRERILEVQERLAGMEGVTILINDQECAAELRRARRRGLVPTPSKRIVINHRICEGCGDCGDVSNCLSVQPFETDLGRKTRIDQASCNFDYSCVKGDCPAFMEVEVGELDAAGISPPPEVEAPPPFSVSGVRTIRLAGIGGTGVVTAAQIIATAAMLDGWRVEGLDQTGLSQKAGPVVSDVVLVGPDGASSNLIGTGEAASLIAFDQLVGAADPVIGVCDSEHTGTLVSTAVVPTGAMISRPELGFPPDEAIARLSAASHRLFTVDAPAVATTLVGEAATTNVLMLGVAVQLGLIPVSPESMEQAIALNGIELERNLAAFSWGRAWASDSEPIEALVASINGTLDVGPLTEGLERRLDRFEMEPGTRVLVAALASDLVDYQDAVYARRFIDGIGRLATATAGVGRTTELVETAARSLHKLMAYKDEYEVARLMTMPGALAAARAVGGRGVGVRFLLHPPMLKALGFDGKLAISESMLGVFEALKRGKRLRGSRLDPFGATEMRRLERELI
ncbi:MAG: indolepyruvate ferredoxin oxidoreductase family protein, partial [Acidimicrobiia bacterium]|nr:indolepyruvate ferredoxin oxidoreductase family protein [Acidimicrobiia bacterium]